MSVLKIASGPYMNPDALDKLIQYVYRKAMVIGGCSVDPAHVAEQMHFYKELWFQSGGKQLRHFIVCFNEKESAQITRPESLKDGAYRACSYYSDEYQIVFGVHQNYYTLNWHIHFVMNNVSFLTGKRLRENNRHDLDLCYYLKACLFPTEYMEICYD